MQEHEGDLVLTQCRELTQAVTRLLGRVRVLEREVRDLRSWALRCGAIVREDR